MSPVPLATRTRTQPAATVAGAAGSAGTVPIAFAAVPGIVHGEVAHTRLRPARRSFRYPAFCLRVPLSGLDALREGGIAVNRRGFVAFHERDHGDRDGSPLREWIRGVLAEQGVRAEGEIVLYTFPRVLGYVFNPVSFWVCHDTAGAVVAVLCEVANTFGERHNYLLAHPDGTPLRSGETLAARKVFHVSPFCEIKGHYTFRFAFGTRRWLARIDYFDGDDAQPLLATRISGDVAPLVVGSARTLLRRYPLFTLAVIGRIHWQALHLWLGKLQFFRKPPPPLQRTTR